MGRLTEDSYVSVGLALILGGIIFSVGIAYAKLDAHDRKIETHDQVIAEVRDSLSRIEGALEIRKHKKRGEDD